MSDLSDMNQHFFTVFLLLGVVSRARITSEGDTRRVQAAVCSWSFLNLDLVRRDLDNCIFLCFLGRWLTIFSLFCWDTPLELPQSPVEVLHDFEAWQSLANVVLQSAQSVNICPPYCHLVLWKYGPYCIQTCQVKPKTVTDLSEGLRIESTYQLDHLSRCLCHQSLHLHLCHQLRILEVGLHEGTVDLAHGIWHCRFFLLYDANLRVEVVLWCWLLCRGIFIMSWRTKHFNDDLFLVRDTRASCWGLGHAW